MTKAELTAYNYGVRLGERRRDLLAQGVDTVAGPESQATPEELTAIGQLGVDTAFDWFCKGLASITADQPTAG
jgi:hypothetical protein